MARRHSVEWKPGCAVEALMISKMLCSSGSDAPRGTRKCEATHEAFLEVGRVSKIQSGGSFDNSSQLFTGIDIEQEGLGASA